MKIHKINRAENSLFSFLIRLTCLFIILLIPCQPKAESMFSEIRRLNIPYAQRFKMHVEGTNAYLGSYNWGELLIIDISNTGAPSIISNTRINQNASFIIHDIWYSNNYVYFAHRNGDVTKVDVSNRQTPIVSFRCMQTSYTHNGLITSYSRGLQKEILYVADHYAYYPAFRVYDPKTNICIGTSPLYDDGREIEITSSGDVLYQAIWGSAPRINVYLVVDPANPSLVRTLDVFAHEMVISPDNKYLYLVYDKPADNIIEGVMIVDISTPTNPVPVATIPLPGARELTLDYSNKRIFVKTRSDLAANPIPLGIYAFDIRNIASIKQLGFHPTSGDNEDFDIWYDNQRLYYVDNNSLGSQFVVLNVNKTNNPPIASNFQITLDEDGTKSFSLNASDPDGDVTTYKILDLPDFGSLSGNPPNYTYTPLKNFHGNDSFIFEISDGVFQASATASITVNPVNDPPFIDEIPAKTIAEMSQLSFHVSASDVDNDPITLSATQLPEGASFVNGNFLWTPDYKQAGVYNVCFIANDPHTSYTRNLTITVTNVNRPPVANAQSVTADEDIDKAITLSGSDPDGETLSYSVKSNPTKGTLSGTPPNLTYTPNPNFNGNDEFRFTVSDGELVAEAVVSIKVNAINDKPVLNAIADQSISEASLLTFTVTGSDVDGDPLTFSAVNLPSGATFNNKTFNWTPGYDQAGSYKITVSVSDGKETVSQVVNITVSNKNRAPVANAGSITTDEDKAVSIVLSGSDPDGENLTYQVTVNPKNGTLSGTAPNLTYTPDANYNGNDELTFTVSDGELVAEAVVSITVDAVNDAPVLHSISPKIISENSLLTFVATGSDVDNDSLIFSAANLPVGAEFNKGMFTWIPAFNQSGSYTIKVSVTDGILTSYQNVTITVQNTPVKAKVYMYDEAMNNPVSSNPRLYLVNVSNETINGGRIEYYFSADNGETPQLDKYYTANVKVTLAHCGDDDYVIIYDLTGIKLAPGAVFPNTGGMVVGISYKNWSVVNKTNDYSNNLAMSYKENEKICIYDDDNRLLGGLKPEKTDILPFADAGRDIWSINTRVNLDASGSYDLLGEIVQHEWIIDGNVVSTDISPMLSFNYGVTTVTLRVTNNEGLSSTDEVNVYVQRDNEVLVAIKEDPVPENTPVNVEYYVPLKLAGCAINLIINNAWGGTNSVTLNGSAGYHDEKIWSWTSNSQGGVGPWTIKVKVNGQITQTMSIKFTK